jgi:hypothetical protein
MNKKEQLIQDNYSLLFDNCPLLAQRVWPSRLRSKPCFGKTKTLTSAALRKFGFTLFIA